jgi:hypothetical protein
MLIFIYFLYKFAGRLLFVCVELADFMYICVNLNLTTRNGGRSV